MKKKAFKVLLFCGLFISFSFLSYKVISLVLQKKRIANSIELLPDFSFKDVYGSEFNRNDLVSSTSVIFVYFNSECEYCQNEATELSQILEKFKNYQFLFVSTEQPNKIKVFAAKHNLLEEENITFLYDKEENFSLLFNESNVPFFVVYDEQQRLKFTHMGSIRMENFLKRLQE